MRSLRKAFALLAVATLPSPAFAQAEEVFGDGRAPVFKDTDTDRRFLKSKLSRALSSGTQDQNCAQLLSAMLMIVAETAPTLHKRDENFILDPSLVQALNAQLTTPRFPGNAYLALMVRRVLIDRRLPEDWLNLAETLNARAKFIDMPKLKFLRDGVKPIDSAYFTLPLLRQRYEVEVLRAPSAGAGTALDSFRDAYLDRDVAWGGLTLVDVGMEKPKKGKKPMVLDGEEGPPLVAHLSMVIEEEKADDPLAALRGRKKQKLLTVNARLSPEQYVDYRKLPKGTRVMVRGRFWEMNKDVTHVELREGLLFADRDWTQGALLADPNAVAACPFAVNELVGTAPQQPGGFGHKR